MMTLKDSLQVPVEVDVAFRYLANFSSVAEWDPAVLAASKEGSGPTGVGTKFTVTLWLGGPRIDMNYRITEFIQNEKIVLEGTAPGVHAIDTITFAPDDQGTTIEYRAEITLKNLPSLLEPLAGKLMNVIGNWAMAGLKRTLTPEKKSPKKRLTSRLLDASIVGGVAGFSLLGWQLHKRRWHAVTEDMSNKTVIITGATSGIGKAAAEKLAELGAGVIIVGRNEKKVENTVRDIVGRTGNRKIIGQIADLSLAEETCELAARIREQVESVDILINNAGAMFDDYLPTTEGIEPTLAINLLTPYILCMELLPLLQKAPDPRVINVSSGGMYSQHVKIDELTATTGEYNGVLAYAQAKRGLVLVTKMLAKKYKRDGIKFHSMHPGWADTEGVRRSLPLFHRLTRPILRTPAQGADTIVWLAASASGTGKDSSGEFWFDREPHVIHIFPWTKESKEEQKNLMSWLDEKHSEARSMISQYPQQRQQARS